MVNLKRNLEDLKLKYREIFLNFSIEVDKLVDELKPEGFVGTLFDDYKENSDGFLWQKKILLELTCRLDKDSKELKNNLDTLRKQSSCVGCGTCCRFAVSEFSLGELQEKVRKGDVFAKQFVETFQPYENIEVAKQIFPEYIKLLEDFGEEGYYIYHCPKVTSDNKCPDYENRPQICRDFPDNPIAFLPLSCGYLSWKKEAEIIALRLRAEAEILNFYIEKLRELL